ncbi:hypothetical protein BJV82DRAFT_605594, partial [Fennellomyces sp. T-0311]
MSNGIPTKHYRNTIELGNRAIDLHTKDGMSLLYDLRTAAYRKVEKFELALENAQRVIQRIFGLGSCTLCIL